MANVVKFKINGLSSALNNVYTRVTDLSRNVLYSGETLVSDISGNVELDIGTAGSNGQGVIVYGDDYSAGNESTFKSFAGYGSILTLQDFDPLTVTKIIFIGASNSDGIVSGRTTYCAKVFQYYGVPNIQVIDASVGGRHADQILNDGWLPIKDNYTGDSSVLVVMCDTLGNDITSLHPYATASNANIETVRTELQQLVDAVVANGNTPFLFETTFRQYDVNGVSTIDDESLGALPFQQDILYPIVKTMTPDQYYYEIDRPYGNLYDYTYSNSLLTQSDGIHYTASGYELLRRFTIKTIVDRIIGEKPTIYPKLTASEVRSKSATPQPTLIMAASTSPTGPSTSMALSNFWRMTVNNTNSGLVSSDGFEPNSITITSTSGNLSYSTNSGFVDDGSVEPNLENIRIRSAYGYTSSADQFELFVLGGFYPNQQVTIGMASYKDTSSSNLITFTFNGNETITCDAKNNSGSNVMYTTTAADASGRIRVLAQKTGGSTAYFNGCHVIA